METATIIAIGVGIGSICMSGVGIITFWMAFSDRITKADALAKSAMDIAQDAKVDVHQCIEKIALQTAAFSIYREQVAREYIHREVMREVEDRLTAAIERLGDRLDRVLEKQRASN